MDACRPPTGDCRHRRLAAHVALRPAAPGDEPFLFRVYAATRAEEMALTRWPPERVEPFLRMQFAVRTRSYGARFPRADSVVVLRGGAPAGLLVVDRGPHELRVVDLALLPEHRGRGVGSVLMRALMDAAAARRVPMCLQAERSGRALGWYLRLGFVALAADALRVELQWQPADTAVGGVPPAPAPGR